jgi:hypothetical protein
MELNNNKTNEQLSLIDDEYFKANPELKNIDIEERNVKLPS